jgi:hypothetical protein
MSGKQGSGSSESEQAGGRDRWFTILRHDALIAADLSGDVLKVGLTIDKLWLARRKPKPVEISDEALAKASGVSVRTAKRARPQLHAAKLVYVIGGRGRSVTSKYSPFSANGASPATSDGVRNGGRKRCQVCPRRASKRCARLS